MTTGGIWNDGNRRARIKRTSVLRKSLSGFRNRGQFGRTRDFRTLSNRQLRRSVENENKNAGPNAVVYGKWKPILVPNPRCTNTGPTNAGKDGDGRTLCRPPSSSSGGVHREKRSERRRHRSPDGTLRGIRAQITVTVPRAARFTCRNGNPAPVPANNDPRRPDDYYYYYYCRRYYYYYYRYTLLNGNVAESNYCTITICVESPARIIYVIRACA